MTQLGIMTVPAFAFCPCWAETACQTGNSSGDMGLYGRAGTIICARHGCVEKF